MAGQNIAGHLNAVYQNILDGVTETLNYSVTSRKLFQEYKWSGSHIEHVLHTSPSGAVKFGSDGDSFPTASNQGHTKFKVGRKILMASVKLTDAVMAAASKSAEVAVDAMSSETEGIMKEIGVLDSFFSYRDGTGLVATVQAGTGDGYDDGTNDDVAWPETGTGSRMLVDDARLLWPGVSYDLYNGTTLVGTITVDTVEPLMNSSNVAGVWLRSGSATPVAGYTIYWKDSKGLVYTGLDGLIDDTTSSTFQNVTMASKKNWTSLVLDNGGTKRDISPTILRNFIAGLSQRSDDNSSEMKEYMLIGSKFMTNQLDAMFESAYRLTPDTKVLGIAAPAFQCSAGKVAIKGERLAPYYKLFACEAGDLRRGYHKKLSWRLEDGTLLKRSDAQAAWTGTLIEFAENFIVKRRGCGKIADLNETISVAD